MTLLTLFASQGGAVEPPPVVVVDDGAAGDNSRRSARRYDKPERLWTVAELEDELRARLRALLPVVREELAEPEPAEAAIRAEEIRDGRAVADLPRDALLTLASEVAALAPPVDAAAMLRVMIELRDEDDAAALLLLTM